MTTVKIEKFESTEILKTHFDNLKQHDGFSLRQWSAVVKRSAAFLSLVLASKRLPNRATLAILAKSLQLDTLTTEKIFAAHERDWLKSKKMAPLQTHSPFKNSKNSRQAQTDEVHDVLTDDSMIFSSWLNLALAEYVSCENFVDDVEILADAFSVAAGDIKRSLSILTGEKFITRESNGRFKKQVRKARFPQSPRSRQIIRQFHADLMKKAIVHLLNKTDQSSFQNRLMTGYTIAVNPEKIETAKVMIEKALIAIADHLVEGPCREVYQLQVQFFPLSNSEKPNRKKLGSR